MEIAVRDWREARLVDGSFDALFALESFEHIADKAGFARMARRAVRPGGRVAVTTWLAAERVSPWGRRHLLDAVSREARVAALVTARELRGAFADAGFSELVVEDLSAQVRKTWSVVLRRLAWRLLTRRAYWSFVRKSQAADRDFARAAVRIWLAFRTGSFRYGYFVWQ